MKKLYKVLRLLLLLVFIGLAAVLPVPLSIHHRDKTPKFVMEQIDEEEEDQEENEQVARWG